MELLKNIIDYNSKKHGGSDHSNCLDYVVDKTKNQFIPLKFLFSKKILKDEKQLFSLGYVQVALETYGEDLFKTWFEDQYSKKCSLEQARKISIYYIPNMNDIFSSVEKISRCYNDFRENLILNNRKKLPVQLGEWLCKSIFALKQEKTSSQRGFDFFKDGKRVEVIIHWGDRSNPKGIKLKKSLVSLSEYTIIMLISDSLLIRDICFLDSEFILRKFPTKGHTIFLKELEVGSYYFSKSTKNLPKVVQSGTLLRFCTPKLATYLADKF